MSSRDRPKRLTRRERRAANLPAPPAAPPAFPGPAITERLRGQPMVATESLGLRKMSEVLEELVEPLIETFPQGASRTVIERAYQMGMFVWNATAPDAPPGGLDELVALLATGGDRAEARQIVDLLVARRQVLFADDTRVIADIQLRWDGGEPHLTVASFVPKTAIHPAG